MCRRGEVQTDRLKRGIPDEGTRTAKGAIDVIPLAYKTGHTQFGGLTISVDDRVLVPRRESELLVEIGAQQPVGARVHEIGTGSGAIALALKHKRPDLFITASDVDEDAASVARHNAADLDLEVPIQVGFLMELPGAMRDEEFDLIIANLPYLTEESAKTRSATLAAEPATAIYDQDDGLGLIRLLVQESNNGQMLALEHDTHHGPLVREMLRNAVTLRDYMGEERVTVGQVWNEGAETRTP